MIPIPFQYLFFPNSDTYDGDTIKGTIITPAIDVGFNQRIDHSWNDKDVRLCGINTPEVRGVEREAGKVVRDYVRRLLPTSSRCAIRTLKDATGKYNRPLADLFIAQEGQVSVPDIIETGLFLNRHLLELGYALPMNPSGQTLHPTSGRGMDKAERGAYWTAWLITHRERTSA